MVHKMLGIREAKNGTKAHKLLHAVKIIQTLKEGRFPAKEAKNWKIDGEKKKNYEEEEKCQMKKVM